MVGGVLPGLTVNTKLVETVRVPSLTVIVMVEVPLWPAAGVMIALRPAPLPPKAILATGISTAFDEVTDSVNAFGEVSASPIVNAIAPVGVSSFVDCGPMAVMVGGVFGLTVSTKFVDVVSAPSLTVTVMVDVPLAAATGVMVTVRFAPLPPKAMFASGTSAVFDELPASVKVPSGVSASPMVNAIGEVGVPSFVD